MDAAAELGRNPVSKHLIQPEYGDDQADAGRDGRIRLARPNSQARTGTGEYSFPCSADHEQDWQPYPVDPYSAIRDDHIYIQYNGGLLPDIILLTQCYYHRGTCLNAIKRFCIAAHDSFDIFSP